MTPEPAAAPSLYDSLSAGTHRLLGSIRTPYRQGNVCEIVSASPMPEPDFDQYSEISNPSPSHVGACEPPHIISSDRPSLAAEQLVITPLGGTQANPWLISPEGGLGDHISVGSHPHPPRPSVHSAPIVHPMQGQAALDRSGCIYTACIKWYGATIGCY